MIASVHATQPVLQVGKSVKETSRVVVLLHGRGSSADAMRPLAEAIDDGDISFLIPQAARNSWYPYSAFGPIDLNEPDLSMALARIDMLIDHLHEIGIPNERIVLGGFSQGACLAAEYVARNAARYGGLFVWSGALIGPKGSPRDYPGSLADMPVFIGSSDEDPWVSHDLVADTARVLERMGGNVDFRTYPGMGHTVVQDEIDAVRGLLAGVE
jgi:predicted esterase